MRARRATAWQFAISHCWSWRHSRVRAGFTSILASNLSCRKSRPGSLSYRSVAARARAPLHFRQLIPKIQRTALSQPPHWSKGYVCSLRTVRSFGPKWFVRSGEMRVLLRLPMRQTLKTSGSASVLATGSLNGLLGLHGKGRVRLLFGPRTSVHLNMLCKWITLLTRLMKRSSLIQFVSEVRVHAIRIC